MIGDGEELAVGAANVLTDFESGAWAITADGGALCGGLCGHRRIVLRFTDGALVTTRHTRNAGGSRVNSEGLTYAHGEFQLTRAADASRCGKTSLEEYCLVIGELTMQEYLYGLAEVPASWHFEALKAQAIAGRSYAAAKMAERSRWGQPFDLYSDQYDQVYRAWNKESALHPARPWPDAVDATDDMVIVELTSIAETGYVVGSGGGDCDADPATGNPAGADPISSDPGYEADPMFSDPEGDGPATSNPDDDGADDEDSEDGDPGDENPESENPEDDGTDEEPESTCDNAEDGRVLPEVVTAFYTSSNGGHTASSDEPWNDALPYLLAKPDPYDAAVDVNGEPQNPLHQWYRTYTADEISRWLANYRRLTGYANLDVGRIQRITIENPSASGRIDDALVTLVGSDRTLEVRDSAGNPFGYRFYKALVVGCDNDRARGASNCRRPLTTKLSLLSGGRPASGNEPPEDEDDEGEEAEEDQTSPAEARPSTIYDEAVSFLVDIGVYDQSALTDFEPHRAVTRARMAELLWAFAEWRPERAPLDFLDVSDNHPQWEAISWLVFTGITQGTSDQHFSPRPDPDPKPDGQVPVAAGRPPVRPPGHRLRRRREERDAGRGGGVDGRARHHPRDQPHRLLPLQHGHRRPHGPVPVATGLTPRSPGPQQHPLLTDTPRCARPVGGTGARFLPPRGKNRARDRTRRPGQTATRRPGRAPAEFRRRRRRTRRPRSPRRDRPGPGSPRRRAIWPGRSRR